MHAQLQLLIQAGNPLISVVSHDEEGVTEVVHWAAERLGLPLFEWSITTGMFQKLPSHADIGVKPGKAIPALDYILDNPGKKEIYFLKDLGPHLKDNYVQRQLREIHLRRRVAVILLDLEPLTEAVRRLAVSIEMPLPTAEELEKVVAETFRDIQAKSYEEVTASVSRKDIEQMAQTLRGLTKGEAARVVAAAVYDDNALTPKDLPRMVEYKRNLLKSAGCLETIAVNVSPDEIGGLDNLKLWLAKRRGATTARAREFGLDQPRGILLLGVQGCGKSLCAKVVAADWQIPLLRLDPGVLYQKYIGESETRLREALAQAQAMAPVVLWIDEIEKAFAQTTSSDADGGVSQRLFATFLTWLQEKKDEVFVVGAANDLMRLPPELLRKGRFDEIFFVDLPTEAERMAVFRIHLALRKLDPASFDVVSLAQASEGFSGAEIEQAVISSLYRCLQQKQQPSTETIAAALRATVPLSVSRAEDVSRVREMAAQRFRPVSSK